MGSTKKPSTKKRSGSAKSSKNEAPDMPSTPRVFRPMLASCEHAKELMKEIMQVHDVPGTSKEGLPETDEERQNLVERLYNALFNLDDVVEQPGNQHHRYISKRNHYTDEVAQANLWRLLELLELAQKGICPIPPWYTTEGPTYMAYASFQERFSETEEALRYSKSCCCSIFSLDGFAARLAWNPSKELKRKHTNKHLNEKKNAMQAVATQACKENDIKRDEDGVLRDNTGKIWAGGKKRDPTPRSRIINGRIKKRKTPSARALVADKLVASATRSDSPASESSHTANVSSSASNASVEPPHRPVRPSSLTAQAMFHDLDERLSRPAASFYEMRAAHPRQPNLAYHHPGMEYNEQSYVPQGQAWSPPPPPPSVHQRPGCQNFAQRQPGFRQSPYHGQPVHQPQYQLRPHPRHQWQGGDNMMPGGQPEWMPGQYDEEEMMG